LPRRPSCLRTRCFRPLPRRGRAVKPCATADHGPAEAGPYRYAQLLKPDPTEDARLKSRPTENARLKWRPTDVRQRPEPYSMFDFRSSFTVE
jgi:hypothetical protein